MSQLNEQGVSEFIRLISELEDFEDEMSSYEKSFMADNIDRIEKYGDKIIISENQLNFIRKVYARIL